MPEPGRRLLTALGVFALGAVAVYCMLELDGPRPNPWITLRRRSRRTGRRQRVLIDDEGRIERGLPAQYEGVHIGDLSALGREERAMRRSQRRAAQRIEAKGPRTFASKEDAYAALLAANPNLLDFLEAEGGNASPAYRAWLRRGRRGPKPQIASYDGRLDAINEFWDLHGKRAAGSWLEAVRVTIPSSRRWDDFADRLPVLEEATGLRLVLPSQAERRDLARKEIGALEGETDRAVDDLFDRARGERLSYAAAADDTPF
jgi:hypothetical protein